MKGKGMKNKLFSVIAAIALLQTAVFAAFYLPESSLWQGGKNFQQDGINAFVEYAVYDTHAQNYHPTLDGLTNGFVNPGSGQYIYAYQIFNFGAADPIRAFSLVGGSPSTATGIGFQNDGDGGIIPDSSSGSFVWRFTNGAFVSYEHSAFLVFSSNSSPVAGNFNLSKTLSDYGNPGFPTNQTQGSTIPEPATICLFGFGAFNLLRKKRSTKIFT